MSWTPLPQPGGDPPRPVSESLDRITRGLGGLDAGPLAALFARWDEVVGAAVAAHAWPVSLRGGTLVVGVDEPIWCTQLGFLETDLVRRLDAVLGAGVVRRAVFRVRSRR